MEEDLMGIEVPVIVREIATDGLPDMDALTGRVAFIFDGCIVSGWPLVREDPEVRHIYERYGWDGGTLWEADSDVGHVRPFGDVTHWVEFPFPVWSLHQECLCNIGVQECPMHPGRLLDKDSKIAFRKAWDARVDGSA